MIAEITPNTAIEYNYWNFYQIYAIYRTNGELTNEESASLLALAHKCPFTDGPVIYNARALYNLVNGSIELYNDEGCENTYEGRKAYFESSDKNINPSIIISEKYKLFPNPATEELNILGISETEEIIIVIKDVSNRTISFQKVNIQTYQAKLKLNLLNGVYFVTLINKDHEEITKKLIIAK
ncbi:T9SS type A sorting domain-containing protein [Aurantibacillus circumpalustris]|uniref:T9SS type A sorting domain-containing protein n=1 Tax=Aurantibacillus circumpalustris TaxID=3036359 RepID=UPI00295AD525|nr:T9SS type A sorting domain-containing protein [Aurantibacillus circumpalustris]